MIAIALIRPAVPLILRNSGANGFQIGLVAALFMAFRAISASFNGYMWDRNKIPSFIIPLSFFLMSLLFYGYYFFATFAGFLLIRALQGALSGTFWPILQLETLKRSGKDSSKALSLYYIFGNIGGVVGILLSAPMILLLTRISKSPSENDALPLLFIIGGSIILFLALTSFKLKVNGNEQEIEEEEEDRISDNFPRYIFVFILN
ncbi:MFS transporter, partial [Candidatus Calescamantes bacterium]|nr:MFS transporter [Candidatus Calescamantes bacterium]